LALSTEKRKELLSRDLPKDAEVRRRATDYMQRTGLEVLDLAKRVGYADSSLFHFMRGTYHTVAGDSAAIRACLIDFMESNPIELATEHAGRLYETENVRRVKKSFYEALDGRRAYYFRGAPGSQKTYILQHLIAELNRSEISRNGHGRRAFYIYCRQGIRPQSLMKRVANAAGTISKGEIDRVLRNLRFDLRSRKVLFVFDESQHLDISCLETLRELHDMPPHCGLLFAGSHELEKTFNRLDMEQWHSRLRQGAELPGVSEDEAHAIIRGELGDQPREKVQTLIKKCYATDLRKGRQVKYISARTLFWSIQTIQEKQSAVKKSFNQSL
jgi:DNA transposition AAA+ family ATPase